MRNTIALLLCVATIVGCEVNTTVSSDDDEQITKQVLDHHMQAFLANDLDATMADYAEESILITPDKTSKGLEQIRTNFVGAFKAFPKDSTTINVIKSVVDKDVAYIVWEATTPTFKLTYATDTFIIRNGKIIRQTYAGLTEPL